MERPVGRSVGAVLVATLPVALAIGVFGAIFGAAARTVIQPPLTLAMSALVFSGVVQFATLGLLLAGGSLPALLLTATTLNIRNLLLGAVLRPRILDSMSRRAGLAWFVLDETVGLALAAEGRTAPTLAISGMLCYLAWLGGTAVGVVGGSLVEVRSIAEAVFPVLFIGLAGLSATRRDVVVRSLAATLLTVGLGTIWPAARSLAPVIAALLVALPGRRG